MLSADLSGSAILFDLDGTLIDSEPLWGEANRRLGQSRSVEVTEELLTSISGLDSTLAMRQIHLQFGWRDFDITQDVAFVQEQVSLAYARGLHWLPGARELLAAVRAQGFRTGLVTSTYRQLVDIVLREAGPENFDVVVCGDDGHEPKPDPASYVAAAAGLGLPSSACVAVEDSVRGVASARAAGCVVLNVSRLVRAEQADAHVESLTDVGVEMFRELLAGVPTRV